MAIEEVVRRMGYKLMPPSKPNIVGAQFVTKHKHAYTILSATPIKGLRVPAFEITVGGKHGTAKIIVTYHANGRLAKKIGWPVLRSLIKVEGDPEAVDDVLGHIEYALKDLGIEHRRRGNVIDIPEAVVAHIQEPSRELEESMRKFIEDDMIRFAGIILMGNRPK